MFLYDVSVILIYYEIMKISLKQLRIFIETAKHKQISVAAQKCHITQAAASMALAELESRLGTPLFDRIGKRLILNEVGRNLLPKALEILSRVTELENLIQSETLHGQLRIGASRTNGVYILPPFIAKFLDKYPQVKIDLQIKNSEAIAQAILNSELDLGFIEAPVQHPELKSTFFKTDRLIIIANSEHPLSKKRKLTSEQLENYSWILREVGSGTRETFLHASKEWLPEIDILMEINDPEAIKRIIKNSNNLSCLPEAVVHEELINKSLVELKLPKLTMQRNLTIISHKKRYASHLLKTFLVFLNQTT